MPVSFSIRRTANDPIRWLVCISAAATGRGLWPFCVAVAASSEGQALQLVADAMATFEAVRSKRPGLSKNQTEGPTVANVCGKAKPSEAGEAQRH